jgi:magnesium transporter
MIATYYSAPDGTQHRDLEPDEVARVLSSGRGCLWIDLEDVSRDQGEPLLRDIFGFHHLPIDDCFNDLVDPPKAEVYDGYLFVIAQCIDYTAASHLLAVTELDLFIGSSYVVSFHRRPLPAVARVRRLAEDPELRLLHQGPDRLAHHLIDQVVDDVTPALTGMMDALERLEEEVIRAPSERTLEEVLRLKRNSQRLRHTMLPMRDVMARFARGEYPSLIRPGAQLYFRDVYDHVVRTEEMVETLRDFADSALNLYLSSINNRTNEVMKTLAVVGALFLPATIVSSIYGTNFAKNIPGLNWDFGFYAMLAVMFLVMAGGLAYFRARRWF